MSSFRGHRLSHAFAADVGVADDCDWPDERSAHGNRRILEAAH